MGKKIDFSNKSNKNRKKKIKTIAIVIGGVLVTYLIVESSIRAYKSLPQTVPENNKLYYNVDEYISLEEVLNRYNCSFIRTSDYDDLKQIYLTFDRDLYTGKISNENHFFAMARVIAEFIDFKNFELIDETRNITISVMCEDTNIIEYKINGDENFYLNKNSEINSKKQKAEVTKFIIQSKELQSLIDNKWSDYNINLGTKESTCDEYDIYFEEGIKYKKVNRKVFNIIFTSKYEGKVAGGLNANSTVEEVEAALGKPTYVQSKECYGYLGENNYLFFDFLNKQVSIYPIQTVTKEDEEKFVEIIKEMNESLDVKAFANDLTDLWTDYNEYDFDSNYVTLKYTLKGFELNVASNSLKNGIYIYQNYAGDRNIQDLENVYIKDTDLVFDYEKERIVEETLNTLEQGDYTEEELRKMGVDFSVRFKGKLLEQETGYKGPQFYSRNDDYADSELDGNLVISSYRWYDDYKFIYSINNEGIYVYNCRTRVNAKIANIEGNIKINSAANGEIIYNDVEVINVNIQ